MSIIRTLIKNLLVILLLLFLSSGCNNKGKDKKVPDEGKKQIALLEDAEIVLSDQTEKLALLASVKKIPYDTLYLVLRDYYALIPDYFSDSAGNNCTKAITVLSKKYSMSESKVASLIFSFKYEMLSKEEITEIEIERMQEEQEQPGEQEY